MKEVHVLHTVGSLGRLAGGPSRTVPSLCRALAGVDELIQPSLLTNRESAFGEALHVQGIPIRYAEFNDRSGSVAQWTELIQRSLQTNQENILHDHGQWLPINRASAMAARARSIPRVVTPRGMLSPWALKHKRLKKWVAWKLFAKRDLMSATLIHATSELELQELRAIGIRSPIAVIPNGVEIPKQTVDYQQKTRLAVFMSRVHPKKGIRELVEVWRKLKPENWKLAIAGPDEARIIESLQISSSESIQYIGDVSGKAKADLLNAASLFVLPSYSENFGVVIAEALSYAVPVITTHGTPWSILNQNRSGWHIPTGKEALMPCLQEALRMPLDELYEMGLRGRRHVEKDLQWEAIGAKMASVYRWILRTASKPACIDG